MSKLLSFIFTTALSPLLPSFFFFIGIKLYYIDFYEITVYYNVLFVDNISWIAYWAFGLFMGFLFMLPSKKIAGTVLVVATLASWSLFVPSVAKDIAHDMFAKENYHIKKEPYTYSGLLLYEGRKNLYLFGDESQRTMIFQKDTIDEAY